jgi:hypothetical protein
MTATRIQPGMLVRLSLDDGAASVGLVTDYGPRRAQDGEQFVHVDWTPDDDHDRVFAPVPASILVAVCEWEDAFVEIGTIACRYDAARLVRYVDGDGSHTQRFCLDHTLTATLDLQRDHLPYEVDDLSAP